MIKIITFCDVEDVDVLTSVLPETAKEGRSCELFEDALYVKLPDGVYSCAFEYNGKSYDTVNICSGYLRDDFGDYFVGAAIAAAKQGTPTYSIASVFYRVFEDDGGKPLLIETSEHEQIAQALSLKRVSDLSEGKNYAPPSFF